MFFDHDISSRAHDLSQKGYVHLKGSASAKLITYLEKYYHDCLNSSEKDLPGGYVSGKKKQFLFEFPDQKSQDDFRDQIAKLLGYDAGALTISERHIKAYDGKAIEYPAPHKDRSASTYSIGIPISLSTETSVCIFPNLDRHANANESASFLKDKTPDEIEALYSENGTIHMNESVGDVVVFEGSALFHERAKPAGSVILYIKVNDQGEDPLNENVLADN